MIIRLALVSSCYVLLLVGGASAQGSATGDIGPGAAEAAEAAPAEGGDAGGVPGRADAQGDFVPEEPVEVPPPQPKPEVTGDVHASGPPQQQLVRGGASSKNKQSDNAGFTLNTDRPAHYSPPTTPQPTKPPRFICKATPSQQHDFLVAASPCGTDNVTAEFISCSLPILEGPVTLSFNRWESKNVKLEVCARPELGGHFTTETALVNCVPVEKSYGTDSAGPVTVTLQPPEGVPFDVVIVAKNFVRRRGEITLISDITAEYTIATPPTVAPPVQPTTAPPEPPGPPVECDFIECDFESAFGEFSTGQAYYSHKDMCTYEATGEQLSVLTDGHIVKNFGVFEVHSDRLGNYVTGIKKAAQGEFYAASYMKADTWAALETEIPEPGIGENRLIRFNHYEATTGVILMVCCGASADCVFISDTIEGPDARQWKQSTIMCPAGTTQLRFVCNARDKQLPAGAIQKNQGACAIDNVILLDGTDVPESNWEDEDLIRICLDEGDYLPFQ